MIPLSWYIAIIISFLLILVFIASWSKREERKEFFTNQKKLVWEAFQVFPENGKLSDIDSIWARIYQRVFSEKKAQQAEAKVITEYLHAKHISPWESAVELGTGVGRLYEYLAPGGKNLVGIDQSDHMLDLARVRNPEGTFIKGDFRNVSLIPKATVQVIFCLQESLYWNTPRDQAKILKSCAEWGAPGGYMVLTFWTLETMDPAPRSFSQIIRDKDDPMLSVTYFPNNMQHEGWWKKLELPGLYEYHERVQLSEDKKYQTRHRFYFPPNWTTFRNMVEQSGWKLIDTVEIPNIYDQKLTFWQKK